MTIVWSLPARSTSLSIWFWLYKSDRQIAPRLSTQTVQIAQRCFLPPQHHLGCFNRKHQTNKHVRLKLIRDVRMSNTVRTLYAHTVSLTKSSSIKWNQVCTNGGISRFRCVSTMQILPRPMLRSNRYFGEQFIPRFEKLVVCGFFRGKLSKTCEENHFSLYLFADWEKWRDHNGNMQKLLRKNKWFCGFPQNLYCDRQKTRFSCSCRCSWCC